MRNDALLLIGRGRQPARDVFETHATRLRRRDVTDAVHVAPYENDPRDELDATLRAIDADTVYAFPMTIAHNYETTDTIPAALRTLDADVALCEPIGGTAPITEILIDRATAHYAPASDTSVLLVGFGSSSLPYQRQTVEYHANRIAATTDYDEIETAYLLQNPAVECARYNLTNDRAVGVPVFITPTEATEREIPTKLELDRGGLRYADPIGPHSRLTDAIHAAVARQRRLNPDAAGTDPQRPHPDSSETRPVATDGDGGLR